MKTAIVTGASRGIGSEIALTLSKYEYNVLINYNHSKTKAEELREKIVSLGGSAKIFKADVTNRMEMEEMVSFALSEWGDIDLLVNNAGVQDVRLFSDYTVEDWNNMLAVHLTGAFNTCQLVIPAFIHKKSGKIINISSIWGEVGASCEVPYSTAKAGLIGFTKALAKELAPSNITVNCITPGVIKTDMLSRFSKSEIKKLIGEIPLARLGSPQDVAETVLFLASDSGSFITGQVLSVNGGMVI